MLGPHGQEALFPLGAGPALLCIFVFLPWNTVPAIQLDLLDRLSVSSIFPKKRQSEVFGSLYLKTVRRCFLVRFGFPPYPKVKH